MSSIFKIERTVSEANVIDEVDTSSGCTTFSARISVTVAIGFRPAFSASVEGITSSALANARKQYASTPCSVCAYADSCRAISISGAPPPAIRARFFTRQRTTHSASCSERSASSSTSLFEPRTTIDTVWPMFWMPVTFTNLVVPLATSSTRSAFTRFSATKWSSEAIGRQRSH
uniref:Uncharacterized protein n=1 Tax=Anopheles coluzzii TaxID=1518534 RepID=A0A8W7PIR2_ANOCL